MACFNCKVHCVVAGGGEGVGSSKRSKSIWLLLLAALLPGSLIQHPLSISLHHSGRMALYSFMMVMVCGAPSLLALGERCHRLLLLAVINSLLTPALPSPHTQQHSNTGNSSRSKARLSSTCGWWLVKRSGVKEVAKERGLGLAGREGGSEGGQEAD